MPTEKSIQRAAQAWCKSSTSSIEMDSRLACAFAEILDEETGIEKAVLTLRTALAADPDFRRAYKDNIAMTFQDEWAAAVNSIGPAEAANSVRMIAGEAADRFLDAFIGNAKP